MYKLKSTIKHILSLPIVIPCRVIGFFDRNSNNVILRIITVIFLIPAFISWLFLWPVIGIYAWVVLPLLTDNAKKYAHEYWSGDDCMHC